MTAAIQTTGGILSLTLGMTKTKTVIPTAEGGTSPQGEVPQGVYPLKRSPA